MLPSKGADSVHVMSMCNALANEGAEVTLIASQGSKSTEDIYKYYGIDKDKFKIELVNRPKIRILGGFIYGSRVASLCSKIKDVDFIYARSLHSLVQCNIRNQKFFFESHWKPKNWIYFFIERYFLNSENLKGFVVISNGLKDIYNSVYPNIVNSEKIHVLHDGCNIPPKNLSHNNDKLEVGYVGSFFKGNGQDLIPDLAELMPDVNFHIVGGSGDELARMNKGKPSNLYLHGHIPFHKLDNLYKNFDIMLAPYQKNLPHIRWVSPMKLFEYMSYKKAIISSDFPVLREVLNQDNSMLVPSDDIKEWKNAIESLKDEKLRNQIATSAYTDLVTNYTWDKRAQKVIDIFSK